MNTNRAAALSAAKSAGVNFRTGVRAVDPVSTLSAHNAAARLIHTIVDPRSCQGQEAVSINDGTVVPSKSFQFDNTFVVRSVGPNASVTRIVPLPSPVFSARIWNSEGPSNITITSADSVVFGDFTMVLNNRLQYVGTITDGEFLASSVWDKFQGVALAGSAEYIGRAELRNGIVESSRTSDVDKLATFIPSQNADYVKLSVDSPISFSAQHAEPTYTFFDVDPNDTIVDGGGPSFQGTLVHEKFFVNSHPIDGVFGPLTGPTNGVGTLAVGATLWSDVANAFLASVDATIAANDTKMSNFIDMLDRKWGCIVHENGGNYFIGGILVTFKPEYALPLGIGSNWSNYITSLLNEWTFQARVAVPTGRTNKAGIMTAARAQLNTYLLANQYSGAIAPFPVPLTVATGVSLRTTFEFEFESLLIADGRDIDTSMRIPRDITGAFDLQASPTFMYDRSFKLPVIQFDCRDLAYSVSTTYMMSLLVNDANAFTEDVKSSISGDRGFRSISAPQLTRFNRIMKGMPPAIQLGEVGPSAMQVSALASRGILKDIVNFVGPVVGTIFPAAMPFIGPVTQLAHAVDNIL